MADENSIPDEQDELEGKQPDPNEEQAEESGSSGPSIKDLDNVSSQFKQIAQHGARPPVPGAEGAGEADAEGTGSAAEGTMAGAEEASGALSGAEALGGAEAGAGAILGAEGAAGGTAAAAGGGALLANPITWIVIAIAIALLVLFIFLMFSDSNNQEVLPISITKSGPEEVPNGTEIKYTLNVTYEGTADDIVVSDPIPVNTQFVSAFPYPKTLDAAGAETTDPTLIKTVEWSLKEIQFVSSHSTFSPQTLTLTVRPLDPDIYVLNQATANVIGGANDPNITPGETKYIPPNDDDCGGYYTADILKNAMHKNFGDPECTMFSKTGNLSSRPLDKSILHAHIASLDPQYADYWFTVIIPCESNFNTNAYGYYPEIDANGAWGLFQMNSSTNNPYPYKKGDVNWEMQVYNAINHNNWVENEVPGTKWTFWQCATKPYPT